MMTEGVIQGQRATNMSNDIFQRLNENPLEVLNLGKSNEIARRINAYIKTLLDPLAKSHSVLDEIYVDGLDASQVYGQAKMVLEGVGESLLFDKIPELKERIGEQDSAEEAEEEEAEAEDEEEEEDEDEDDKAEKEEDGEDEVEAKKPAGDLGDIDADSDGPELSNEDPNSLGEEEFQSAEEEAPSATPRDQKGVAPAIKKDVFGLNDGFFDIDEFNRQSLALENGNEDENDDDGEIDFFADLSDGEEEEENMAYFDDFYEKPTALPQVEFKEREEDGVLSDEQYDDEFEFDDKEYDTAMDSAMFDLFDEEEQTDRRKPTAELSTFEKQQRQIQDEIATLEAELVGEKKWNMKGEVSAKDRPQDSLLEDAELHNLNFERTAKPVPVITQEVTETLEDMIRRRIKEEQFDDLPKRLITDVALFHNRQKYELSEQKSAKSLAEIYEDEFQRSNSALVATEEVSAELQRQHDEIGALFASVTHKLDSLSSAHFIPKPHQFKQMEIKVTDSAAPAVAAISMEDAQPLHISSDAALAPQEIYKVGDDRQRNVGPEGRSEVQLRSGLSIAKDEMTKEDKLRLRRQSKRKKSKEFSKRREVQQQRDQQREKLVPEGGDRKRAKVSDVISTLSKAKNVSVIGKKGEMTDVKGQRKKKEGPKGSSGFKL